MQVKWLKRLFGRLGEKYEAAGAFEPADDMRKIAEALKAHEDKSVDAFVIEAKKLLGSLPPEPDRASQDDVVVRDTVRKLLDAGADRERFDALLSELDALKLGKQELFAIANQYRNLPSGATHVQKFKSLRHARSSIMDVFLERADAQRKRGTIDKLTKRAS